MTIKMPESMDECFYFTNRILENDGSIIAWVYKPDCPKCKKAKMGKPVDPKTDKVKSRADVYVCKECGYEVEKAELDPTLKVEIQYKCPFCGNEGETTTEFKRKSYKGVQAYVFTCEKCGEKIGITKKMKKTKK
jgi:transcription elongation factor Elf1